MTRRSSARRRLRAAAVGTAALALTGLLGACTQDDTRNAGEQTDAETSAPVPSPTPTTDTPTPTPTTESPTPTPTTETPTPTPTATTAPAPALTTTLLPARRVAGLNDQWRWRDGETRTSEPTSGQLADCIRFSLAAIGASETVVRDYRPPAPAAGTRATALELVAGFPDQETAVRVMQVLRTWADTCQNRLNRESDQPHRVSQSVRLPVGDDAFAYLHSTRGSTPDTTDFEDVAQVRVGDRIALVVVRLDEQDYNYEPKRTPAARTLAAAAAALG